LSPPRPGKREGTARSRPGRPAGDRPRTSEPGPSGRGQQPTAPERLRRGILAGAARLGIELDDEAVDGLLAHVDELRTWAPRLNLVSAGDLADPTALVERHVVDSLAALPVVAETSARPRILDLGSGAGFPGIPIAVALRPACALLVEPRLRRASFLRSVARRLPGVALEVAACRAEELPARALGEGFDVVVSRATLALSDLLVAAARCLVPGGRLVAFRGPGQAARRGDPPPAVGLLRRPDHLYRVAPEAPEMRLEVWEKRR
jgi:16S rRNA (guanine527-N7)-methyltransferase